MYKLHVSVQRSVNFVSFPTGLPRPVPSIAVLLDHLILTPCRSLLAIGSELHDLLVFLNDLNDFRSPDVCQQAFMFCSCPLLTSTL